MPAVAAALLLAVSAAGARERVRLLTLTERGVDGVQLGRTLAQVRATGRIAAATPGCELVSPRPLVAQLRAPLKGYATFDGAPPHRLIALDVVAGVQTTRHVAVHATAASVHRKYPAARLLVSKPSDPIQLMAYIVRRGGKDRMWFRLDHPRGYVAAIDVPAPQICE